MHKVGLRVLVVGKMERWAVMETPNKHRFCTIGPICDGFDTEANLWD